MNGAVVFSAVFVALFAAHQIGDYWVQTHTQATLKGSPGWAGRLACARHVATLTATKAAAVLLTLTVTHLSVTPVALTCGLGVDAISHYWADRRSPLAKLATWFGKSEFWRLGAPQPGDAPHLGTGAHALDQSWHVAWLFFAALVVAGVR